MQVMKFTMIDLQANREGNLSDQQADQLLAKRRRNTLIGAGLFILFVFLATLLIFLGQINENVILSGVGGLLTVLNAVMLGMVGRSYLRVNADLRDGSVEMLEGELERVVRPGRQRDNYLFRIDGVSFYVTKDIFVQFRHEASYRFYRTRYSGVLLSAEPLN